MNALDNARLAARAALEKTYHTGLCSVIEYQSVTDDNTKITRKAEVTVLEDVPCKLALKTLDTTVNSETAAAKQQGTKLFLAPNIIVKAGSKIVVTQNGVTTAYKASGEPAVYPTHTEVVLDLFAGWA